MPIPEQEKTRNDIVDIMIDACTEIRPRELQDGTLENVSFLNNRKVWLKTHNINSNRFGRYSFYRERLSSLAKDAANHMTWQKARILQDQIENLCQDYDYSVDAKSSEAISDKNNASATLIDKINRKETTRRYILKDEIKKSMWQGFIGRDDANRPDNE